MKRTISITIIMIFLFQAICPLLQINEVLAVVNSKNDPNAKLNVTGPKITFTFDDGIAKQSTLSINNGSKEVIYTGLKEGNTYTKKVSDNLTLEEISVGGKTAGTIPQNQPYQIITIKARDIFVDKNYDINILIKTTQ